MVSGTPSAVPLTSSKLDRMSLRTIPLCSSTSGPFDPSPGYGPAVPSGISPAVAEPGDGAEGVPELEAPAPHAVGVAAVAPRPRARSMLRRLNTVTTRDSADLFTRSHLGVGRAAQTEPPHFCARSGRPASRRSTGMERSVVQVRARRDIPAGRGAGLTSDLRRFTSPTVASSRQVEAGGCRRSGWLKSCATRPTPPAPQGPRPRRHHGPSVDVRAAPVGGVAVTWPFPLGAAPQHEGGQRQKCQRRLP